MDLSLLKTRLENKGLIKIEVKYDTEPSNPTPLSVLFHLHENAGPYTMYADYYLGLRLVIEWLSPFDIPKHKTGGKIPALLGSYELVQMAKFLDMHPVHLYQEYMKWTQDCDNSHIAHA